MGYRCVARSSNFSGTREAEIGAEEHSDVGKVQQESPALDFHSVRCGRRSHPAVACSCSGRIGLNCRLRWERDDHSCAVHVVVCALSVTLAELSSLVVYCSFVRAPRLLKLSHSCYETVQEQYVRQAQLMSQFDSYASSQTDRRGLYMLPMSI